MHNHHQVLKQLSFELNNKLKGYRLVSCFSQNKDELMFEFNNGDQPFFIKAYLHPDFCCISFPSQFKRARKNSIDLFESSILKLVKSVYAFENERAFALELENDVLILFKMFGNQSNVVLFENKNVTDVFRSNFKNDFSLSLNAFTTDTSNPTNQKFYIVKEKGNLKFSLDPQGEIFNEFNDAVKALNEFFYLKVSTNAFSGEKRNALRIVSEKEKKTRQYLSKTESELAALQSDDHFQTWADLIMANLHVIKKGVETIDLNDFVTTQIHSIKLKKELSPQQNAGIYYRKAKNKVLETKKLNDAIAEKKLLLEKILFTKSSIDSAASVDEIKKIIQQSGLESKQQTKAVRLPYREIEFKDYSILVGKNAADNDELTLKHTFKEDLWLHAKDVAGSHVVIKYQSGKVFPKDVIERAAELAAFFSKRKGESLCPVAYTAKKFVRKRKGDPPGAVVVENEKVIMVEPKGP